MTIKKLYKKQKKRMLLKKIPMIKKYIKSSKNPKFYIFKEILVT